jgi:hypothetical protein
MKMGMKERASFKKMGKKRRRRKEPDKMRGKVNSPEVQSIWAMCMAPTGPWWRGEGNAREWHLALALDGKESGIFIPQAAAASNDLFFLEGPKYPELDWGIYGVGYF